MTSHDLVPVFTGNLQDQSTQLCNARDLHTFLGVGRDFSTWIKERIAEYGFTEGDDFITVTAPQIRGAGNRGKRTDYHLTLDMAKELAMIENNDQGRAVRRYFIAVEKRRHLQNNPGNATLPAPEAISKELRNHITTTAHQIALKQYSTIYAILTDCVNDNLACGATQEACFDSVDAYAQTADGTVVANIRDLRDLVSVCSEVIDRAGTAIAAVKRIEQRSGFQLYYRQEKKHTKPGFRKFDRLIEEVIDRMAGEGAA